MKKIMLFFVLLFAPFVMAQTNHKVTLRWTASTSTNVTHYGVYRSAADSTCPECRTYVYLGYTTGTSYINGKNPDGTPLVEGARYYYVVVAFTDVDPTTGHSLHSLNSNEVGVNIPVTVVINPATNVTATVQ